MRVIITCGGTGGHITPALAIADLLREALPDCKILFIGTVSGMENEMVRAAGYEICTINVKGLSRKHPGEALAALKLVRAATSTAGNILNVFHPDIVIGTGGYACYPALLAANRRRIPTAVHESNAVPGLTVRMLASKLSRVWLGFEAAKAHLPRRARVLVVGNPVLGSTLCSATPCSVRRGKAGVQTVLSFGGSLGAPAINRAVLSLMQELRDMPTVRFVHATGKREWESFTRELVAAGLSNDGRLEVLPFISDMPRRMREATVVISRAGAMTLGELAEIGRAAILIPSPHVTGNHQYKNAAAMAEKGAAILMEEDQLGGKELACAVRRLLIDHHMRKKMESEVKKFAHPDATEKILADILLLTGKV